MTTTLVSFPTFAERLLTSMGVSFPRQDPDGNMAIGTPFYDPYRFKVVMAGERTGKSFGGAYYAGVQHEYAYWMNDQRDQLIWLVGQDYEACYPEFEYLTEFFINTGELSTADIHVREGGRERCDFTIYEVFGDASSPIRLRVETITGGNPQKIARLAPNGIVGCEIAAWTEELFHRCLARTAQKRGWFWGSGSFESSTDWLAGIWHAWQDTEAAHDSHSYDIPSWSNRFVYPLGRLDPEILRMERVMPAHLFSERVAGKPALPSGAVYPEFNRPQHVTDLVYDPAHPVEAWVDPGYAGAYAVLFVQEHHDALRIIDEIYVRGETHEEVCARVRDKPFGKMVTRVVMDKAGTQHHAGKSAYEVWTAWNFRVVWHNVPLTDGIMRVHSLLKSDGTGDLPRVLVSPKCHGFLGEAGAERPVFKDGGTWTYRTDREGNSIGEVPESKNNHAWSAFAYGAVDRYGFVVWQVPEKPVSWYNDNGPSWLDWAYEGQQARRERRSKEFFTP